MYLWFSIEPSKNSRLSLWCNTFSCILNADFCKKFLPAHNNMNISANFCIFYCII